jgi:hypothetical protein
MKQVDYAEGTVKQKQEPPSAVVSATQIFPRFIFTNSLHNFRPKPEPFSFINPTDIEFTSELKIDFL